MNLSSIPQWTAQGLLPPYQGKPTSPNRSPYRVSLVDVVLKYATSRERNEILQGYLEFRAALHAVGLTSGFQWIDGSFFENIELSGRRAPHDMDVVTFFHLPEGQTQESLHFPSPDLFDRVSTKAKYHIDSYFVLLNGEKPEPLVRQSTYWYSVWSHRRIDELWKGFLQVDLFHTHDLLANEELVVASGQGG